jgi:hypothetical protein
VEAPQRPISVCQFLPASFSNPNLQNSCNYKVSQAFVSNFKADDDHQRRRRTVLESNTENSQTSKPETLTPDCNILIHKLRIIFKEDFQSASF